MGTTVWSFSGVFWTSDRFFGPFLRTIVKKEKKLSFRDVCSRQGLETFQDQYRRAGLPVLIPERFPSDSSEVKSFNFRFYESDNLHYFRRLISTTELEIKCVLPKCTCRLDNIFSLCRCLQDAWGLAGAAVFGDHSPGWPQTGVRNVNLIRWWRG